MMGSELEGKGVNTEALGSDGFSGLLAANNANSDQDRTENLITVPDSESHISPCGEITDMGDNARSGTPTSDEASIVGDHSANHNYDYHSDLHYGGDPDYEPVHVYGRFYAGRLLAQ